MSADQALTTPPTPARVLEHPSRRRIAEALAASAAGLTAFELADAVGLHHNAVRQHLEAMARAGLVSATRDAPGGRRGRPSIRYRLVSREAVEVAGHRELVRLLVALVRRAGASERDVEEFGREEGRVIAEAGAGPRELVGDFARLGFAPEEVTSEAGRRRGEMELRLRHCPFKEAVLAEGGHLVCALHRGLTLGILDRAVEDANLVAFEPHDPIAAGCRVALRGLERR
jgi:predicted ArsR family transcriptional regulator